MKALRYLKPFRTVNKFIFSRVMGKVNFAFSTQVSAEIQKSYILLNKL